MDRTRTPLLHAGWLAGLAFALALAWAGAQLDGYDAARHSIGVLGSTRSPVAPWFNLAGFVLPGALLAGFGFAFAAQVRRSAVPGNAALRIGLHLHFISAIAFALQGVLPMNFEDGDGVASQRHVFALTIALLAMAPSMVLVAIGLARRGRSKVMPVIGAVSAIALVALIALPPHEWLPGWQGRSGLSQRLAFVPYFAWPALLALAARRRQPPL